MTTPLDIARQRIAAALQTHATDLRLNDLGLDRLPEALWQLTGLETLDLSGNALTRLDDRFAGFVALRVLDLRGNRIARFHVLLQLPRLAVLHLAGNLLDGLPEALQRRRPADDRLADLSIDFAPPSDLGYRLDGLATEVDLGTGSSDFVLPESRPETARPAPRPVRAKPPAHHAHGRSARPPSAGAEPADILLGGAVMASPPPSVPTPPLPAGDRSGEAPPAPEAEPVDSAVFCPPQVGRGDTFLVQCFLYPPEQAAEAEAQARAADASASRRGQWTLSLDVPPKARIDLHLDMHGLTVTEPDTFITWRGRIAPVQFEVAVSPGAALGNTTGSIRFAVDGNPAGTLRFQVAVAPADAPLTTPKICNVKASRYRKAFISYSSKDRGEVLRRVQTLRIMGVDVFQDILSLDPGDRWAQKLYLNIDECDVFMLFWSKAAAESPWVGKEIDYAVARKHGQDDAPPDIQPVPIEAPIPQPPPALSALHFNDALLAQIVVASST